ncbi:MAG TPA: linear amide C-N hydrolase [Chitinophagaceae bacterium]
MFMRMIAFTFILSALFFTRALPCSTFFIHHNGQMVFGRNYDWVAGTGIVCTNQRGLFKTSYRVSDGGSISWTSRYGSLTFNQYGKEFPTGGMNEKGLVVELMWLDETVYPGKDDRPAIGVLQWIQYQLDNNSTIDEVIASDKLLRITATTTPLHYLVADATGAAATIEFLGGKMVVHKGENLSYPVLTNSVYSESVSITKDALKNNKPAGSASSTDRFIKACKMVEEFKSDKIGASLVDHSFRILDAVSQGDYTRWSIVYDITNRKIHFKTNSAPMRKSLAFSAFEFACDKPSVYLDMNQEIEGEVSNSFRKLNPQVNAGILRETAELSKSQVSISRATQEALVSYANLIGCNKN